MDSDYDHDYEADEDASKVLQRNVDAHQDLITNAEARLDKQDPAQTSDCKASLSHALAIEPEIEEADSSPDDGVALPLPTPTVGIRVKEKDMSSRKRRLGKDPQIQILTRKVNQYKKLKAELRHQLSKYYSNEAIGFLENKVKEKQLHVELLVSENKSLLNQQRLLERQLEELQDSANSFPQKAYSMREELRICKEKLRQYREKQKVMDEKAFKMHQQIVDLAAKNKGYCDRIRIMEIAMTSAAATATTSSRSESSGRPSMHEMEEIIANQEDAITRLQQKVALHKKVVKTDHSKYEKVVKQSQDAVNELRAELDSMSQQLFEKERVVRAQVLYIKKLKRSMRELSASMQSNQHLQQYTQFTTLGRDGRVALQQFSPRGHTATGPQVREALYQLGFMPSYASLREEESRMQADEAAMLNHTPSSSSVRDKSLVACTTPKAAKALGFASRATDGKENADANALHSTAEDKEKMMKRAKLMQSPTDTMVSPVSAALTTHLSTTIMGSTLDIKLNRIDRIFRPNEIVQGQVLISSPKGFAHNGISMKVEGSARLQLSAKSTGLFEAFYNSVQPMELVYFHIPVAAAGKVPLGITKFPFEFELQGIDKQPLFETYHGVYVSVKYEITVDCVRGMMKRNLHKTMEFIVEVPLREPMRDSPEEFQITPDTLDNVRRQKHTSTVPYFNITGRIHRTNCPVNLPFTGELVIEHANAPVKSVELQLIRVESVAHTEGVARDATEIQNVQIGWGDVCRQIPIPIYMIFPRLFTCPTMITNGFKVEFETNVVVLFEDGNMITENFPLTLYR
ncbi:TPA: hypothetical protein N0F65_002601 [Lagenidium giganteum]|uniref:Uncharacterized protein n=1 Tax=Lagenidium giganteum TaxID=4803 RepID=A0AAV2YZ83_9STRA|nr:TPA: hypothetical protein N0F65_002601 [Lagenidium giganteum]